MRQGKYPVWLGQEEREQLQQLIRGGNSPARRMARARILLKTDEGWTAPKVAEALDISVGTVFRTKRRFAEGELEATLQDRPQPRRKLANINAGNRLEVTNHTVDLRSSPCRTL